MKAIRLGAMGLLVVLVARLALAADAPASRPATRPAKVPEVLRGAVDPLDEAAERTRFFTTAGADNELSKEEFAAGRGKKGGFVRAFDTWAAALAFDKNANGSADWFEARAYRRNLRERVLAAFDANKDGKLAGAERDKANAALAAGRVPAGKASRRGALTGALDPRTVAKHDADGDGQLSRDERRAMFRARAETWRGEMLAKYDTDKDGKIGEAERKALVEEMTQRWRQRRFDADGDGELSGEEIAAADAAEARMEAQKKEWASLREEMIKKHDADGDGELRGEERRAAWGELRDRWMTKAFDGDGDGKLSEAEAAERQEAEARMKATYDRWQVDWTKKYDADGDGTLSDDERRAGFRKEAEQLRNLWQKQWDTDGDGTLSDEERQEMRTAVRRRGQELRKELDADGDGRVTGPEMRGFLEKLRKVYDTDGDGVLSPDETRAMLQDQMRRMRSGPGGR